MRPATLGRGPHGERGGFDGGPLTAASEPGPAARPGRRTELDAIRARSLFGLAGWCRLVAILGLLDRRRERRPAPPETADARPVGRPGRLYGCLAAAVLPLYIPHQPIVVAVAYGVVGLHLNILLKYSVISLTSLVLTVAAYDVLVRRIRVTRFLFGMRARP